MLFDPFEKQLDLPAHAVELGDREGRQCEVVGQEDQPLAGLRIFEPDPSQGCLEALARIEAGEHDSLIADQSRLLVHRVRVSTLGLEISLGTNDKEAASVVKATESIEVDITAIHDVDGAGLRYQLIQDVDVV